MKTCSRCKIEKPKKEYYKSKKSSDRLHTWCKECMRKRNAERRANDPEYKKRLKEAYERYAGSEKAIEKSRRNHQNNADKERQHGKDYYHANKEKRLDNHSKWINKNREYVRAHNNSYMKNRMATDILFALATRIRKAVRNALCKTGLPKKSRTFEMLGYSRVELNEYLSRWIDKPCEICGLVEVSLQTSHIDHIIPISMATTEEEIIFLNQLKNLRLICAKCNMKKGDKHE